MIELFVDSWQDGWLGKTLAVLMGSLALALLYLIGWGAYSASDYCFLEDREGEAVVVEHRYRAAYTHLQPTGKTVIPIRRPARWMIAAEIDGGWDWISTTPEWYRATADQTKIRVRYRRGRWSKDVYITKWL